MTLKKKAGWLGGIGICWLAVGCQSNDPGLEEELSRLRQENRELTERLETVEQSAGQIGERSAAQVEQARDELAAAQAELEEIKSRFDRRRLEASFAEAVSEFKQETLKKFPSCSIRQVTLHQMVMPSDHPFSSGVTMVLNNDEDASTRTLHVKALGNLQGDWTFKKVDADTIASQRPETGAPPTRPNPPQTAAARPDPNAGGQSSRPSQPPVRRATGSQGGSSGGKVYRIEWGD